MEWWQSFFDETFLNFGLKPFEEKAEKEVDFILNVLKIPKNALILDLACGVGRHSIELAKRGYKVVGVDFKKDYINYCKEKARKLSLKNARFIQTDMRKLKFKNKFDAVISVYTSFGYFKSEEENLEALRNMAKALKKNGKFFIDVANRDFLVKHFRRIGLTKLKQGYIKEERSFEFSTSKVNAKWTFLSKDKRKISENKSSCRVYSYHELKNMFESVGLKVIKSFGNFKGEEISSDANRLILVGQKM
jgi:SAM-dependent methyltransferase